MRQNLKPMLMTLDGLALQAASWTVEAREADSTNGAVGTVALVEPIAENMLALVKTIKAMHAENRFNDGEAQS